VISSGCLLTEGEHLLIDKASPFWKDAMQLLFEKINLLQEKYDANSIVLRDFHNINDDFESYLIDNGFFKISMPDNNVVNEISWNNADEFYALLSKKEKMHLRKDVRRYQDQFKVEIANHPTAQEIDQWYSLYLNVKGNSLELNTFTLPRKLFDQLAQDPGWETLTLNLSSITGSKELAGVVFSHIAGDVYIPMIIGIDYSLNGEYKVYRQALYQLVMRAGALKKKKVLLGFSAPVEKKKVGAELLPTYAFMQIKDNYNAQTLSMMNMTTTTSDKS
jgi:hypothetical protein